MRNFSWLNTGCPNFVSKYFSVMMQERGGGGWLYKNCAWVFVFQRLKCENKLWLSCAKLKFSLNQNNYLGEDLYMLIYKKNQKIET